MLLLVLLLVYVAISLLSLALWSARGVYSVTGDEPHYLVIADGLVRYGSLELAQPYLDEFASRAIYEAGLTAPGTTPVSPFAHVLVGANGLFSWHGLGIAFLVAPAFAVSGVLGAKLVMVALGALVVMLAWRISGLFSTDQRVRFLSVLAVAISYPLIPASTQIYPDLVGGLLALVGIYYLLTVERPRRVLSLAGYSLVVGYLPWLGTKFTLAAVVLTVAMVAFTYRFSQSMARSMWLAWPVVASLALLAAFNVHAFGRLTGPPAEGAFEASATSFMVLGGLLLDQDQGILMQNPILWLGLFGVGAFVARYRSQAVVWLVVFATIWIPGAMHVGWYGLGSMVGRYSWALAVLFIVPALLGLAVVAERARRLFFVVVVLGIAVNALFLVAASLSGGAAPGAPAGFDLYTKTADTWLESYAVFYFPLQDWMPALYNVDWAYGFWPNWVWLLLALAVLSWGFRRAQPSRRVVGGVAVLAAVVIGVAGIAATPGPRTERVPVAAEAGPAPGYLSGVPIRQMRQGPYTWSVTYTAAAAEQAVVGRWELVESVSDAVVASGELRGTASVERTVEAVVPYFSLRPQEYSLRVASYGTSPMQIVSTGVRHG